MFSDRVLAGPPADRGVRLLRINAAQLLGIGEGETVTVRQRDEHGNVVRTQTIPAKQIELAPSADIADYLVG